MENSIRMQIILRLCHPFKVFNTVIMSITILMIHMCFLVYLWQESLGD